MLWPPGKKRLKSTLFEVGIREKLKILDHIYILGEFDSEDLRQNRTV